MYKKASNTLDLETHSGRGEDLVVKESGVNLEDCLSFSINFLTAIDKYKYKYIFFFSSPANVCSAQLCFVFFKDAKYEIQNLRGKK